MYYDTFLLILFVFIVMLVSFRIGYAHNTIISNILYYPVILSSIAWILLALEYITIIIQMYNNSTRLI